MAAEKPTAQEICPQVFLYTSRTEDPTTFTYELECAKFKTLEFTVNFEGSANFELEIGGLSQTTTVEPFERKEVAKIIVQDPTQYWSLKTGFSMKQMEPNAEIIDAKIQGDLANIQSALQLAERLDFGADSATIAQLTQKCIENSTSFVDVEWPPSKEAVFGPAEEDPNMKFTWRRPKDFMDGPFQIFEGGVEPSDIRQGSLGDCWFMSALACIAEFPALVERIFEVPKDGTVTTNEHGVYRLKFCKNGEWSVVTVDDYFPCFPEAGPVFSRSHGNELWVLLIEKAYAKLHGGYYQLRGGWCYEGMMDLTGAPTITIRLDAEETKADIESGALFNVLKKRDEEGCLMSCSTPGEDKWTEGGGPQQAGGLVPGHAYALLQVKETAQGHQLLNIRNPWGSFEWDGDWGDTSELWTEEVKADPCFGEGGVQLVEGDGAFWMSFADFLQRFNGVNICRVRGVEPNGPPAWVEKRLKGYFRYDKATGEVCAPMYILDVPTEATVYISIHQEDERVANSDKYIDMGVALMCLDDQDNYHLVAGSGVGVARETQIEAQLPPGRYVVVPTTTGCKFAIAAQTAEFADTPVDLLRPDGSGKFTALAESCVREMFRRLNESMDGGLDREELGNFQRMSEGIELEDEVFNWMMETFDSDETGLTADGLVQCYLYMLNASGGDQEVVFKDLRNMGYSNALDLVGARTFVLAVHADDNSQIELTKVGFDAEAYEEAMELPIKKFGTAKSIANGRAKLYMRKAGYWGVSFAVENLTDQTLDFTMDCKNSKNVVSHCGKLKATVVTPPHETKVTHHLMPKEHAGWSWGYTTSSRFHN